MTMRPIDIIKKLCPKARGPYLEAFEHGDGQFVTAEINTPLRLAHFLAQILHESGELTLTYENMNYRATRILEIFGVRHSAKVGPEEADDLAGNPQALADRVYGIGNPKKAKEFDHTKPGDGYKYRGGGLMQTTGKANYRHIGDLCGLDLETYPDLVCTAEHALKPAISEWKERGCNALADKNDLLGISRAINLGNAKSKAVPNGLSDREALFKKVRPLCEGVTFRPPAVVVKPPPDVAPIPEQPQHWFSALLSAIASIFKRKG